MRHSLYLFVCLGLALILLCLCYQKTNVVEGNTKKCPGFRIFYHIFDKPIVNANLWSPQDNQHVVLKHLSDWNDDNTKFEENTDLADSRYRIIDLFFVEPRDRTDQLIWSGDVRERGIGSSPFDTFLQKGTNGIEPVQQAEKTLSGWSAQNGYRSVRYRFDLTKFNDRVRPQFNNPISTARNINYQFGYFYTYYLKSLIFNYRQKIIGCSSDIKVWKDVIRSHWKLSDQDAVVQVEPLDCVGQYYLIITWSGNIGFALDGGISRSVSDPQNQEKYTAAFFQKGTPVMVGVPWKRKILLNNTNDVDWVQNLKDYPNNGRNRNALWTSIKLYKNGTQIETLQGNMGVYGNKRIWEQIDKLKLPNCGGSNPQPPPPQVSTFTPPPPVVNVVPVVPVVPVVTVGPPPPPPLPVDDSQQLKSVMPTVDCTQMSGSAREAAMAAATKIVKDHHEKSSCSRSREIFVKRPVSYDQVFDDHPSYGESCTEVSGGPHNEDVQFKIAPCEVVNAWSAEKPAMNAYDQCNVPHNLPYLNDDHRCFRDGSTLPKYQQTHQFSIRNNLNAIHATNPGQKLTPSEFPTVQGFYGGTRYSNPSHTIDQLNWNTPVTFDVSCPANGVSAVKQCDNACLQPQYGTSWTATSFKLLESLNFSDAQLTDMRLCYRSREITLPLGFHECLENGWASRNAPVLKQSIKSGLKQTSTGVQLYGTTGISEPEFLPLEFPNSYNHEVTGYEALCKRALESSDDRQNHIKTTILEILKRRADVNTAVNNTLAGTLIYRKEADRPSSPAAVTLIQVEISQGINEASKCKPSIDFSADYNALNGVCEKLNGLDGEPSMGVSLAVQQQCLALRKAKSDSNVTSAVGLSLFTRQ